MGFWSLYFSNLFSNNLASIFFRKPGALMPLDGLRALAILWVFTYHSCFLFSYKFIDCIFPYTLSRFLANGDMGVDLFFVLSGFLIGFILFKEIEKHEEIDKKHFYTNRFLRIWPGVLMLVVINVAFGITNFQNLPWYVEVT